MINPPLIRYRIAYQSPLDGEIISYFDFNRSSIAEARKAQAFINQRINVNSKIIKQTTTEEEVEW